MPGRRRAETSGPDGRCHGVLPGSAPAAGHATARHATARDTDGGFAGQSMNEAVLAAG
jgi:hypothetical protein